VFYDTLGADYINIAFAAAAAADPSAKLYYNDYNIEYAGPKATAAQQIVKNLQAAGLRIDGVGLESHFIVGETPSQADQEANMNSFIELGVEVAVTELDIRFSSLPPTAAGLTQQAEDFASTVGACVNTAKCVGITVWDFDDAYSWVPSTFAGNGDADLYWSNLTKVQPAYNSVVSALGGEATASVALPTGTAVPTTAGATPTSTGGTQVEWGQCGGIGWTGPTACDSPFTCEFSSAYYSQCL